MYKCECGKEFENAQSFNGHKSHCKIHLYAKYNSNAECIIEEHNKKCTAHTVSTNKNRGIKNKLKKQQELDA